MKIFPDSQGQLTPQSEVGSDRNSNSSKLLWLSRFLTCTNEEDPIKTKELEWSQNYTSIFRRSGTANSLVGDVMWPKFEFI